MRVFLGTSSLGDPFCPCELSRLRLATIAPGLEDYPQNLGEELVNRVLGS